MTALLVAGIGLLALGGWLFWMSRKVGKDIKDHPTIDIGPVRTEILPDGRVRMIGRGKEGQPVYGAWAIIHEGRRLHCPELWEDSQEKAEKVAKDHRRIGYEAIVKKSAWSKGTDNWTIWIRELPKEQLRPYLLKRIWYSPVMFWKHGWTPSWSLTAALVGFPAFIVLIIIVIPAIKGDL